MEAYLKPRELHPVGPHPLCDAWEGTLHVAMHEYLTAQRVAYTSLDPVSLLVVDEDAVRLSSGSESSLAHSLTKTVLLSL